MSVTLPAMAEVVYPDTDGEPMGDNSHQLDLIIALYQTLTDHFAGRPDVAVHTNLIWYPVKGRPDLRRAPGVMVVFDRPPGRRRSYLQWEEDGVAPQVVFEIFVPGNRPKDLLDKLFFYKRFGVEEYYFFDPDGPSLSGWREGDDGWDEIDPVSGFTSPWLGLTFGWPGGDTFDLLGPAGRRLRTHEDLMRAWLDEQARADAEQTRANDEKRRAEDEKRRADRLAEELRKLGLDPDRIGGGAR